MMSGWELPVLSVAVAYAVVHRSELSSLMNSTVCSHQVITDHREDSLTRTAIVWHGAPVPPVLLLLVTLITTTAQLSMPKQMPSPFVIMLLVSTEHSM